MERTVALVAAALLAGGGLAGQAAPPAPPTAARIDRQALVSRHDIAIHAADPMGAMAVGNGEFAFNFDVTGAQSFPEYYEKTMPVGILSTWGWHSFPNPMGSRWRSSDSRRSKSTIGNSCIRLRVQATLRPTRPICVATRTGLAWDASDWK